MTGGDQIIHHPGEFRDRVHAELGGDVGAVEFHGALVDAELGGDLFVEQAEHDVAEHLALG